MLNKLRRGIISPAADPRDLEDCYGTFRRTGLDPLACFSEACRMFAAEVGSMHVATDPNGQTIVAQSGDERTEIPDDDFVTLASPVTSQLREALRTRELEPNLPIEFPIFSMPRHHYSKSDGACVAKYGRYLTSFRLIPSSPALSEGGQ